MYSRTFFRKWPLGIFLLIFLFTVTGWAQNDVPQLNDAQIAHIAVIANQIDVDYGKVALTKTKDAEVLQFAEVMIRDHEAIIAQATALATKLGVTPEDNDVSKSLMEQQKTMVATLKNAKKDDFAKLYIDNEVAYHQAVVDAVKGLLIPQTQNAELKSTLEKVVPLLEHHLEMAVQAQRKITQ